MRLVRAPLAAEIALRVAPAAIAARIVAAAVILGPEALHAGPGVDQRAVHREMIPAHLPAHVRVVHDARQERRRRVHGKEPLAVLGERRGVPYPVVDAEPDEPAEQEVKVQPLHQLALGPDGVEGLEQQRAEQPLRRDRGAPKRRIGRIKGARHPGQDVVRDPPDHPQRMALRNAVLEIDIGKQAATPTVRSAHPHPPSLETVNHAKKP